MTLKDLQDMEMLQTVKTRYHIITRVPNGWLFECKEQGSPPVFVPWSQQ